VIELTTGIQKAANGQVQVGVGGLEHAITTKGDRFIFRSHSCLVLKRV
jgi:hypothetical protein